MTNQERAIGADRAPVPAVGVLEFVALLFRRRDRLTVQGRSMVPTLDPGDTVLVDRRAYRKVSPSPGEVVLCRHPFRTDVRMVKRVVRICGEGDLTLAGDNPDESTDSDSLGAVPAVHLLGRITGRIRGEPS